VKNSEMKILIAEDDFISRRLLEATLIKWGYDVVVTSDGNEAWQILRDKNTPRLAILDWMMPGIDGINVCRKVRSEGNNPYIYIIILTAMERKDDIVTGLEAGADDYITKPFNTKELCARVQVGIRMLNLQQSLTEHVKKLEDALSRVKQLQGLLPICAYCKRIRDDENYWQRVETYIANHSEAQFSHSICPECYDKIVKPEIEEKEISINK
jgi:sigma-B regulation protein RsbU (phosphoserine phosphatase)